jgi:hypothetical protein
MAYHKSLTPKSRLGAFRATALSARGAVEASAPPASRNRLQRFAYQLSHKKNFDHGDVRRSQRMTRQSVGG